jgi:hypothetical protein
MTAFFIKKIALKILKNIEDIIVITGKSGNVVIVMSENSFLHEKY